jgi:hypothetical protein
MQQAWIACKLHTTTVSRRLIRLGLIASSGNLHLPSLLWHYCYHSRVRVMFRRYDNLKRVVALVGVVLTLSCSAQTGHFLCLMAGCSTTFDIGQGHRRAIVSTTACAHENGCRAAECMVAGAIGNAPALDPCTGHNASAGDRACSSGNGSPCPCPPGCWCHQMPAPFSLPKIASVPIELILSGFVHCCAERLAVADCTYPSVPVWTQVGGLSVDSSVARCAQLCRFLI